MSGKRAFGGRSINIRRHLLGVVRRADVDAILGPPRHRFYPNGWSSRKIQLFWKEERRLAQEIVREGRAKVREIIVRQRERTLILSCSSQSRTPERIFDCARQFCYRTDVTAQSPHNLAALESERKRKRREERGEGGVLVESRDD